LRGADDPGLERTHKNDVAAAIAGHGQYGLDRHLLLLGIADKFAEFEYSVLHLPAARAAHRAGITEKGLEMSLKTRAAFGVEYHDVNSNGKMVIPRVGVQLIVTFHRMSS